MEQLQDPKVTVLDVKHGLNNGLKYFTWTYKGTGQ